MMKPQRYYDKLKKDRLEGDDFNKDGEKVKMKMKCDIEIQSKYIRGNITAIYF